MEKCFALDGLPKEALDRKDEMLQACSQVSVLLKSLCDFQATMHSWKGVAGTAEGGGGGTGQGGEPKDPTQGAEVTSTEAAAETAAGGGPVGENVGMQGVAGGGDGGGGEEGQGAAKHQTFSTPPDPKFMQQRPQKRS